MTLQQLRYFVSVARIGSIRGAARSLFISEPTLSQQLKVLQREVGGQLFVRADRHLEMTELGQSIFEPATAMLEQERAIRHRAERAGMYPALRIGAIPAAIRLLLPRTLRLFQRRCPGARVTVHEEGTAAIIEDIRSRDVDYGIVASGDTVPLGCDVQRRLLLVSRLVLCESLSGGRSGDKVPLIMLPKGYALHHALEEYARSLGCKVLVHAASAESALRFVASGVGWAILPHHMVAADHGVSIRTRPLPPGPGLPSGWKWELVWRDRELASQDHAWIKSVQSASAALPSCEAGHAATA